MQTTTTAPAPTADLHNEPPDLPPVRMPDTGPTCLCGARLGRSHTSCRKCRARERWHRRNRQHAEHQRRTDSHRTTALLLGGAR